MSTNRTEKEQVRVHIRWMIRRDMPEVLQTEQESFEYSWTEEDFLRCLRQRNCIGMVAEQGEKVVGFMIYELHKNKLHILNFAVNPGCRRFGVGAQMVAKLQTREERRRTLYQGGITITTTLDPRIQDAAQKALTERVPIGDAVRDLKTVDPDLLDVARVFFG